MTQSAARELTAKELDDSLGRLEGEGLAVDVNKGLFGPDVVKSLRHLRGHGAISDGSLAEASGALGSASQRVSR